jgi:hypothetical protein
MTQEVYNQAGGADKGMPATSATTSPAASAPTGVKGAESIGNEPITRETLEKFGEEILTKAVRQAQSLTDKMGSTLDHRIKDATSKADEAIKLAEKGGIAMTDQQKQQIRQNAVNEAISQPEPTPEKPAAASTPDFVDAEVKRIMAESGIYISPDEAATLIGTGLSPFTYVEKFKQLVEAKQRNPSVRLGTLAPGGNAVNDVSALKSAYDNEIALINAGKHPTIRRGQTARIVELKNEYRKKGLTSIW